MTASSRDGGSVHAPPDPRSPAPQPSGPIEPRDCRRSLFQVAVDDQDAVPAAGDGLAIAKSTVTENRDVPATRSSVRTVPAIESHHSVTTVLSSGTGWFAAPCSASIAAAMRPRVLNVMMDFIGM